jgi:uncharacterized RDD family membrane protein YckC
MREAVPRVRNPFPGLRPFRSDEEHLFFGRENQVDRMLNRLAAHRFLAVVGTSGCGKSSLVNCGLRPALHRGYMASAGASWRMAQFRPGSDPIDALAQALAAPGVLFDAWDDDGPTAHELVKATLRLGSLGLVDIVGQARLPENMQLLVVVDQFEELFRFRGPPAGTANAAYGPAEDAIAFVKLLLEARAQAQVPIHVVLTMRSDFLGDCAQFLGLAEAINDGQYLVPRLTREEIRAAITGPVGVGEAAITPMLVTRLLNDVGDNPDQLSILQHALNRTWANWENECGAQGPIDLAHYEAVGGMADALNRHAERAFGELGSDERKRLAERMFKALTDKGTDARGVRRPTRLAQLCAICAATQEEVESVLVAFRKPSRSFLVPPAGEALTPDKWIDISHESLMRVWKRLAEWAAAEAESARTYRRLSEAAMLWRDDDSSLLRDPALRMTLDWRERCRPNAAWAAQYQGHFDSVEAFLQQRGEARAPDESDSAVARRWLATRWDSAMACLDRSRDTQMREQMDAEIERRWLASWWRYAPFTMMAILFIVGQMWFEQELRPMRESLRDSLRELPEWVTGALPEARQITRLLSHLVVGMPAALGYVLLAPYTRRRFREKARARIEREAAAGMGIGGARDARGAPARPAVEIHATSYATFGRRAFAHVLDYVGSYGAWLLLLFAVAFTVAAVDESLMQHVLDPIVLPTMLLVPWIYDAWSLSSKGQATPGMRLAGVFATDVHGRRLSFLRATARHFARFLSYYTVFIGFLMQPFNTRRQTLHDRLSGTVVLRRPPKAG